MLKSIVKRSIHTSRCIGMTFEGNKYGIQGSDEERMTRIFGGRIKGEPPKSTSRRLRQGSRLIAGVSVPEKPAEPDNCCMSGCATCVWELFNDDLREWKHKRKEAAEKLKGSLEKWPADFDPPLTLLDIENVPAELKTQKIKLDKQKKRGTASLFPPRTEALPQSVIEAKRKNALLRQQRKAMHEKQEEEEMEEGWNDVPVYIRAFAEFEKRKKALRSKEDKV